MSDEWRRQDTYRLALPDVSFNFYKWYPRTLHSDWSEAHDTDLLTTAC